MRQSFKKRIRELALCGLLGLAASGCMGWRQGMGSSSLAALFQPKIARVSYEEPVEEIPEEPADPTRLKLSYARWMEEMDQPQEARAHYATVINKEPENVEAMIGLARLDLLAGNSAEAESRLRQAMKLEPGNAMVQYEMGRYLASQKRWHEAVEPLQKAMLSDPLATRYRHQLAVALVYSGDVNSAIPHFAQTVGDAEAHYNVALILKEQGDLEQAERQLMLALTKNPEMVAAQQWLVEIRRQRGALARRTSSARTGSVQPASAVVASEHSLGRVQHAVATSSTTGQAEVPYFEAPQRMPQGHSAMVR